MIGTPRDPQGLIGLGIEMVVPIVLFMYVGHRVDRWLEAEPWFFIVGACLGIALSFYSLFKRVLPTKRGPDRKQD